MRARLDRPGPSFRCFPKSGLTVVLASPISTIIETRDRHVEASTAVAALGALAQEHRLAVFRLLVEAGSNGLAAGTIARALDIPNSSLSFHLSQLSRAGLIAHERRHRSLIYRADYAAMSALVAYLMENCCAGATCAPAGLCGAAAPNAQLERKSA